MALSEEKRKIIENKRKTDILNAAIELFDHYGFDKCKMSNIAEKAGMSKGLIYHYFSSKEEVLLAMSPLIDHCERQIVAQSSAKASLILFTKRLLWSYEDLHYHSSLRAILLANVQGAKIKQTANKYSDDIVNFLSKLIIKGQKENTVRDGDPKIMADVLWHTIIGYIEERFYGDHHDLRSITMPMLDQVIFK